MRSFLQFRFALALCALLLGAGSAHPALRWTVDYAVGFDCHRFEVVDHPHHTILLLR